MRGIRGKCRRAPEVEHAVNTLTRLHQNDAQGKPVRNAPHIDGSASPKGREHLLARKSIFGNEKDPASWRAGRDEQSSDRLHIPAVRTKQRAKGRPADPGPPQGARRSDVSAHRGYIRSCRDATPRKGEVCLLSGRQSRLTLKRKRETTDERDMMSARRLTGSSEHWTRCAGPSQPTAGQ
jgi:hypothetical protein